MTGEPGVGLRVLRGEVARRPPEVEEAGPPAEGGRAGANWLPCERAIPARGDMSPEVVDGGRLAGRLVLGTGAEVDAVEDGRRAGGKAPAPPPATDEDDESARPVLPSRVELAPAGRVGLTGDGGRMDDRREGVADGREVDGGRDVVVEFVADGRDEGPARAVDALSDDCRELVRVDGSGLDGVGDLQPNIHQLAISSATPACLESRTRLTSARVSCGVSPTNSLTCVCRTNTPLPSSQVK